jgi:tRNA A-37 threonylcarbamoyl transferase component Bud32
LVPPPTTKPVIPDASIETRLHPTEEAAERYVIENLLGTGATSHVYAARDRTFDREVAIKFLEAGLAQDTRRLARFIREARMTAHLDHPNIVPVYDLDSTPAGDLYLTMRRVEGLSLGEALRRAAEGPVPSELGNLNQRVNIMLKVCDALACAHSRGIAHLDVKPDNIMLGPFGEVVLVDWGLARRVDEAPRSAHSVSGTPAYMSPEQSNGHPGDALADIYCLGATLFHTLTLRYPTWGKDEVEFWAKKRAGTIDQPTEEERARIPKQLLAIAMKALSVERSQRYQSMQELGVDLQHYQAGQAVSAYRESRLERAVRWHRIHARTLWTSVAVCFVIIGSAAFIYGERLKEVVVWGAPVYRQDFSSGVWRGELVDIGAATKWIQQDGRVVSAGREGNYLFLPRRFLPRRFYGSIAVEVEGEILPGAQPCDLSLAWSPSDPQNNPDWKKDAYFLQPGAYDNSFTAVTTGVKGEVLARSEVRLIPGVRYHVRFEVDEDRFSIDLDGRRICEYRTSFPCTSGFVGLYGFYPGKAFDNLAVYTKGVPRRLSPTAVGDAFYYRDLPLEAADHYRLVAESFAGTTLADEAIYKRGLCLAKLGKQDEAMALWQDLRDLSFVKLAECRGIELTNASGDIAGAASRFAKLYREAPDLRPRLRLMFGALLDETMRKNYQQVDLWLNLTLGLLPSTPTVDTAAARVLYNSGRWREVVERYPHIERSAAAAWLALDQPEELLRHYPNTSTARRAMFNLGHFDELATKDAVGRRQVLQARGLHEEAAALRREDDVDELQNDLLRQGRSDEALANAKPKSWSWYTAMTHCGRNEEAADQAEADGLYAGPSVVAVMLRARRCEVVIKQVRTLNRPVPRQCYLSCWISAVERHDEAAAADALVAAEGANQWLSPWVDQPWFVRYIAVDFVRYRHDLTRFNAAMNALVNRGPGWQAQRPWHAARYMLGEIDEATYLSQPACGHASAALLLLRAMRAELAGNPAAALTDYRAYLALPLHKRLWDILEGDPVADHFTEWRVAELSR